MAIEIERKFLVVSDGWRDAVTHSAVFRQGYIVTGEHNPGSVRVRISGEQAWLNLKSATRGMKRLEFEYPLPLEDAIQILDSLCETPIIEKTRHYVRHADHTWEVDVFEGENTGLVVAEVELETTEDRPSLPDWVGSEVTDDLRYYNACLVKHPFSTW
jgi:adenylate cyclase